MKALTIVLLIGLIGCTPDTVPVDDSSHLQWDAPIIREDGTPLPLSEIGGYRVYSSNSLNGTYILVDDVQNNTYLVDSSLGYVYITTYDVRGDESKPSNIVLVE